MFSVIKNLIYNYMIAFNSEFVVLGTKYVHAFPNLTLPKELSLQICLSRQMYKLKIDETPKI